MNPKLRNKSLGYYRDQKCRNVLVQKTQLKKGLQIAEVGSGTGKDLVWYSNHGVHCVAIEVSFKECIRIKELFRKANPSKLKGVVRADGQDLPFRDEVFDVVLSKAVLHHLQSPIRAIREMRRIVKNRGCVACIDEPNALNPLWHIVKFVIRFLHIESFMFSAYLWIRKGRGHGAREDFTISFYPWELSKYFEQANFNEVWVSCIWLPYVIYINPGNGYSETLYRIWLFLERIVEKTPIPNVFGQLYIVGKK